MSAINISPEAMQSVVSKAIMDGLTQEQRDGIIEQAVAHLIAPPAKRYSYDPTPPTPIQAAFDQALDLAVLTVAREMVQENAALQDRIRELMGAAVAVVLSEESYSLTDAVRNAVGSAISEFREAR